MRSFTALVNPLGRGRLWTDVEQLLREAGAEVTVERTQSAADATARALRAAARGDVAIAVGGDGLVRDVAGAVVAQGGVMGIVPAGRGNDFATTLGIGTDPGTLAETLLNADPRAIDVLDANGVIVPGNVFCGVDSLAARIGNQLRWLGWLPSGVVYQLAALLAFIGWRPPTYTVTIDAVTTRGPLHGLIAGNSGTYGGGLRIVPSAVVDDGQIHVITLDGTASKRELIGVMRAAKRGGGHVERPDVRVARGVSVTVAADRPVPLNADGDEIGKLPVTITVLPGALHILKP